jgi:hypothetical protein
VMREHLRTLGIETARKDTRIDTLPWPSPDAVSERLAYAALHPAQAGADETNAPRRALIGPDIVGSRYDAG